MPAPRLLTALTLAKDVDPPPAVSNTAMAVLYRAALGPVQLPRYLALFERFDRAGRAPLGWNLPASVFTLNWMVLHHLWGVALVYLALVEGLALLVFGVGRPLLGWPTQVQCGLFTAFALFAFALPALFGDALLHSEIRKRIQRALAVAQTMPQACEILSRQASSQRRLGIIVVFNVVLFAIVTTIWALVPPDGWPSASPATTPVASGKVKDMAGAAVPAALASRTLASAAALPGMPTGGITPAPPQAPSVAATPPESAQPAPSANPGPAPAAIGAAGKESQTTALAPPPATPTPPDAAPVSKPAPAPASKPDPVPAPKSAPVPAPKPVPKPAVVAEKAPKKVPEKVASKTPTKAPTPPRKKETAPAPAPESTATADLPIVGSTPGYYLNVGMFAEVANARRAQAKLLNIGLPAFRQTFSTPNGERTRLRVGPYPTLAEAQKTAAQIRRLGFEAVPFRQRGG